MAKLTQDQAEARHIKRDDYVSCTVAFIDCKKPGSHLKENYSIIGPGVTSSDEQVINLPEAHGFNIGAAAMPNGITNNLHIHFTAEVFIVQQGEWTFRWGSNGENEVVGTRRRHRLGADVDLPRLYQHRARRWLAVHGSGRRQYRRRDFPPRHHPRGGGLRAVYLVREPTDRHLARRSGAARGSAASRRCPTPMSPQLREVSREEMLSRVVTRGRPRFPARLYRSGSARRRR